jgi:hypothetical protein
MDALKKQGKRTDLTSDQVGPKLSAGKVSDTDSASQVKRYIRLTKLIPKLLAMVDENKISFSVGVELSYLTKTEQADLFKFIEDEFGLKTSSVESMMPFLRADGLLEEVGRNIYVATSAAKAWCNSGNDLDFIRIIHSL